MHLNCPGALEATITALHRLALHQKVPGFNQRYVNMQVCAAVHNALAAIGALEAQCSKVGF
jgi:hypothetical protein